MNTRERLARMLCEENCGTMGNCSCDGWGMYEGTVDAILDELMEIDLDTVPDGDKSFVFDGMPKHFWQAILTAIREGK